MASMTGYGRSQGGVDGREMTVELKSVNHRYLDLTFRMPRALNFMEEEARKMIAAKASRGHIDVLVQYRNLREDAREVVFDEGVAGAYIAALERIGARLGSEAAMEAYQIAALPDVLIVREREEDQEAIARLFRLRLGEALDALCAAREAEGLHLSVDIGRKLDALEGVVSRLEARAPQLAAEWRDKLMARMTELLGTIPADPARIVQEAGLLAERAAVDEELVRLRAHIASARDLLKAPPSGKKLDFVAQEMNREMNTAGSKASDIELTALVIEGKSVVEKIREQVQNLE